MFHGNKRTVFSTKKIRWGQNFVSDANLALGISTRSCEHYIEKKETKNIVYISKIRSMVDLCLYPHALTVPMSWVGKLNKDRSEGRKASCTNLSFFPQMMSQNVLVGGAVAWST